MSIATRTTYLAKCDYPDCHMAYDFWASSTEDAVENIIDDDEWLCLFTGDNEPRFFCPLHLRYVQNSRHAWSNVFYDSGSPDTQTALHALNKYYEAMSTPQPLPKLECEDTIYAVVKAQIDAYHKTAEHCCSMLGYSGSMLSCLTYEDTDNSDPSDQPQVGDYGVAVRETADGQEEIPFHIELEEHTGLPVAVLNTQLYAKPEDDIDDGQYVSLLQLYLDGFMLSRTGRNAKQAVETTHR